MANRSEVTDRDDVGSVPGSGRGMRPQSTLAHSITNRFEAGNL
jgi:hypothetical protein